MCNVSFFTKFLFLLLPFWDSALSNSYEVKRTICYSYKNFTLAGLSAQQKIRVQTVQFAIPVKTIILKNTNKKITNSFPSLQLVVTLVASGATSPAAPATMSAPSPFPAAIPSEGLAPPPPPPSVRPLAAAPDRIAATLATDAVATPVGAAAAVRSLCQEEQRRLWERRDGAVCTRNVDWRKDMWRRRCPVGELVIQISSKVESSLKD
jgi:hypothetical protein